MPSSCASASAAHTWPNSGAARWKLIAPSRSMSDPMSRPRTYSITRYSAPWAVPKSKTCTVFGWVSRDTASASRRKRLMTSLSPARSRCRTFIAAIFPIRWCSIL